jgi:tRNA A37 threonylcarbamoyladenosine modification protein TsaB
VASLNFFVLDTSLQGLTLGLVVIEKASFRILKTYGSTQPSEAAARIPELCLKLLVDAKLTLSSIYGLLVSHGPGSFTGIKIGLSFASGWNRAGTHAKIYAVSSLRGLQRQLPPNQSILLPATQTAGYFSRHEISRTGLGVIDLSSYAVATRFVEDQDVMEPISAKELREVKILGLWPKIEAWLTEHGIPWSRYDNPKFHDAIIAGMVEEFIANSGKLSEGELVPIYLRKSAPEEKLDNLAKALSQD